MRWITLAITLVSACRGDPQQCERAVRNYASLVYWKEADAAIAAATPHQREETRRVKLAEFEAQLKKGLPLLVNQCTSANNKEQIRCMIEARTAEQAQRCSGD